MNAWEAVFLSLCIAAVLYFGVGTIVVRLVHNRWEIPNRAMWLAFGKCIACGCRKSPATTAYHDNGVENDAAATTAGEYFEAPHDSGSPTRTTNNDRHATLASSSTTTTEKEKEETETSYRYSNSNWHHGQTTDEQGADEQGGGDEQGGDDQGHVE